MSNIKLVSIIMATYNRADFIIEALQSIKKQTYLDFECIIIDDGGTDNTLQVIEPVLKKDSRFQFLKRPDKYKKGLPGCRNYGLDLAKGDFIIFFDDDDIVHPQNLELCIRELSNNQISFCRYDREVFFNEFDYNFNYSKEYTSFMISVSQIGEMITNKLPFNSCAIMWSKECFTEHRFVEHLMYAEEWELYSRILSSGVKGISIKKCLFYGRKHLESNTGEFFNHNPVRRESHVNATLLIIENLNKKELLSNSLILFFITLSLEFKEYNLFSQIIKKMNLSMGKKIKYKIFYKSYPLRIALYKIKKSFNK